MRTYHALCDAMRACDIPFARTSWEPLDPSDIPPLRVEEALRDAGFAFDRYTVPLGDGIVETVWGGLDCIGI